MDGDLSLSQSFGGLRIANPDDDDDEESNTAIPPSNTAPAAAPVIVDDRAATTTTSSHDQRDLSSPFDSSSPSSSTHNPAPPRPPPDVPASVGVASDDSASPPTTASHSKRLSIFNVLRRTDTSDSRLTANSPGNSPDPRPTSISPQPDSAHTSPDSQSRAAAAAAASKAYRQSMPLNHQAQQQALSTPYSSSQNLAAPPSRGYSSTVSSASPSRPVSGVYAPQAPPNSHPDRQPGSYRLRSESSRSSMTGTPSRSDSRSTGAAMQAGVISRENSHRDRTYNSNHQLPIGNGPLPPRQSSRGMAGAHGQGAPYNHNGGGGGYTENGPLPSSEEWKEKGAAVSIRQELDANGNPVMRTVKKGVKDFVFGRTLGEGSYSTVLAATDRQTLREYAVKILDKRHIIKEKKIKYVNIEKNTLNRLTEHPGIVRLYYTFQDEKSLYYVLDVASGGELLGVLKKIGTFDEECTRFYGAQILDAIEYMHSRGVIHRDLKPENVLLDDQMHVKITDFGTAKLLRDPRAPPKLEDGQGGPDVDGDDDSRATSFVGTAEYVSPELLTDKNACKASDLWAFGCIIYQLLSGRPPFKGGNEYQTFQKIVGLEYEFPHGFPPAARDLVERLLVLDPQRRLSIEHIKNHEFFTGIKWGRGLWKMKAPRLKPYIPNQEPHIISLNGQQPPAAPVVAMRGPQSQPNGNPRPPPRVIYELPPPTQLDIEWSPVLTRNNERILKLGNLMVLSASKPHSPGSKNGENEGHKMISRFFGGSTTKKRQRLIIVTSSGRIIMAASGEDKRTKGEISLVAPDCTWRSQVDAKGLTVWCVDTGSTHYTFEEPKGMSGNLEACRISAEEWIEALDKAKDMAIAQSMVGSYSSESGFGDMTSSVSSLTSTLGPGNYEDPNSGNAKRKRFSKRASKNGLGGPVF